MQMAREIALLQQTSVENSNSPYAELLILNDFHKYFKPRKAVVVSGTKMNSNIGVCLGMKVHERRRAIPSLPLNCEIKHHTEAAQRGVVDPLYRSRTTTFEKQVAKRRIHFTANVIDNSRVSPKIIKERLESTLKDYKFYPNYD